MALDGIPISDSQCIGESLPIINNSFITLDSRISSLSSGSNISGLSATIDAKFALQTTLVGMSAYADIKFGSNIIQIAAKTGTTYTLALSDAGYLVTLSNTSPITLSVPTNAAVTFPIGTQILLNQLNTGQVTVSAVNSGTTSVNGNNGLKTAGQYAIISLIKIAADAWIVGGDATI